LGFARRKKGLGSSEKVPSCAAAHHAYASDTHQFHVMLAKVVPPVLPPDRELGHGGSSVRAFHRDDVVERARCCQTWQSWVTEFWRGLESFRRFFPKLVSRSFVSASTSCGTTSQPSARTGTRALDVRTARARAPQIS
jgi:hypothetical protein